MQVAQQRIEPRLYRVMVATAGAQGANKFGDHLLEHGRVIREGRSVNGGRRQRGMLLQRGVQGRGAIGAHA